MKNENENKNKNKNGPKKETKEEMGEPNEREKKLKKQHYVILYKFVENFSLP